MKDFSIQEAIDNNKELWIDILFNHELLGINKQAENKFKLCYKYPNKENKDFYLIIVINEFKSLKMITTYEAKSSRRMGENEFR